MSEATPPFFLFDGACGFCEKWARWLDRRVPERITFVPYQAIDDLARYGLTATDVQSASYWIDSHGHALRGNRSIAQVLRQSTGIWKLIGTVIDLPIIRMVFAVAYFGISRNRHRLPAPR